MITIRTKETINGKFIEGGECRETTGTSAMAAPHLRDPGTTPRCRCSVCLAASAEPFRPENLYQLVYKVKDPYVLGAGTAAFRDLGSFFRYG